jgi:hypothetical protein
MDKEPVQICTFERRQEAACHEPMSDEILKPLYIACMMFAERTQRGVGRRR